MIMTRIKLILIALIAGDDEYTYLYDYYENKYPEYNKELKHYGKND